MRVRATALTLMFAATVVLAQDPRSTPPPQSTFRAGAHFVRVDAYPSRNGGPVTDLEPSDFEIHEDGVLQKIEAFEHVVVPPGGPESLRIQPNSVAASRNMASDPRARVFVVFLDLFHMDVQQAEQMRTPLRRFLEDAIGPDDLVAVMTPRMSANDLTFTRRTSVLSGVLDETLSWLFRNSAALSNTWPPEATDEVEEMYLRCYPERDGPAMAMIARRRQKLTLDALNDLAVHLGALRDERKAVLVVSLGWRLFDQNLRLAERGPNEAPPPIPSPIDLLRGGRGRDGSDIIASSTQSACEADRLALAHLDHRERVRDITGDANRANVSFYPFAPLRNPAFSPSGTLEQLSTLREMAENTDGLAIVNTNNLQEPAQRLAADLSSYYLLGYQSTNPNLDGRFRSIKVTVNRPGVQVRARRGYRAVLAEEVRPAATAPAAAARPAAPAPDAAVTRAINGLARLATASPLRVHATAWRSAGGETMLWVVGELDAAERRRPAWSAGATAEIAVLGNAGPTVRHVVNGAAGWTSLAARIPGTGTLAPGEYSVRVVVRPTGGGEPLSDIVTAVVPESSALGAPRLLRRGPATGIQYVETADVRFRRNERLRLELPSTSDAAAEARLVDRAGQKLDVPAPVTTRPDPAGFSWVVVDLTMAPFAPGDYAVVVSQEGATQVTGFKVVP